MPYVVVHVSSTDLLQGSGFVDEPISPSLDHLTRTALLGGSWVVISGVISRVTVFITHIRGLITPRITTHEPPSRP